MLAATRELGAVGVGVRPAPGGKRESSAGCVGRPVAGSLGDVRLGGVAGEQDAERAVEAPLGIQTLAGAEGPGEVRTGGPVQRRELLGPGLGALVVGCFADLAEGVAQGP